MPAASLSTYARIVLAMPGTADEIAAKVGMRVVGLRRILQALWSLKVCHPGEAVRGKNTTTARWIAGEGQAAPGVRSSPARKLWPNQIAFAHLWRELELGGTVPELQQRTGQARVSLYRLLKTLRKQKAVYICGWGRDQHGKAVAIWTLGKGVNAPKPPRSPKTSGYWSPRTGLNRAVSILTRLGAANDEKEAA